MKMIRPMAVNDAALLSSNIAETDYAAWAVGTTYALAARVMVVAANVHKVYESLQAGNVGHTPATSPTWWLEVGNTNRWRMFDQSITSQSSNADSIDVSMQTTGRIDSVALLNVSAATAHIQMTDTVDGTVYNKTYNLVSDSGITDWYAYFFEPIARKTDLVVSDLPVYSGAVVRVLLSEAGNTVLLGALVVGLSKQVGGTQYGAKIGIQDYSVKTRDAFGNYSILERSFNKTAAFTLLVDNGFVDQLFTMLSSVRATPVVYVGSDNFSSMAVYGFFKDFDITVSYPKHSICTLQIEGLT